MWKLSFLIHLENYFFMSDHIIEVNDDNFEAQVIKADKPVLVDYWAEWCNPCRSFLPILEKVASKYDGVLTVTKLNIDDNQDTPQKYGVRAIPTLMLFRDGELVESKVGMMSETQLVDLLDSYGINAQNG